MHKQPKDDAIAPSLGQRLLAALLAPIVFNASLLLLSGALFKHSRSSDRILLAPFTHNSIEFALLVLIGLPALAGFVLGPAHGLGLLSHLLFLNPPAERSLPKTLLAWGCLLLIAYLIHRLTA